MIVDQSTLDRIQRLHQRTLTLPVRRGRLGELKRCPLRPQGVYTLKPRVPFDQYRERAEQQPTRARAVLALIDLCDRPTKPLTITVLDNGVTRDGDTWLVRFEKGNHADRFDRDVYLCRNNDFTMDASRQTVRGDAPYLAPLAEDLRRARAKATEKRAEPNRSDIALLRAAHRRMALRKHTMSVELRRQLERTGKAIDRLAAADGAILPSSDCAQRPEARDPNADTEPDGIESVVSLEPAA